MMMDRRRLIAKAAATLALTACDKPPPSPVRLAQGVVWDTSTRAFSHLDRPLDVVRSWDFASGDGDFTATEAELNHRPGRGLEVVSLSADPQLRSPAGLAGRGRPPGPRSIAPHGDRRSLGRGALFLDVSTWRVGRLHKPAAGSPRPKRRRLVDPDL